jgi:hypothetical protein
MIRFSRAQLLGGFVVLTGILVVLLIRYLRLVWWAR